MRELTQRPKADVECLPLLLSNLFSESQTSLDG